jgi:hypothetical protein
MKAPIFILSTTAITRISLALAAAVFLMSAASMTHGRDIPLRIEIKTLPTVAHNKRVFVVDTTIRNTSNVEQVLQTWQCSYGDWNWTTDNPAVHVQEPEMPPCKKNALVYMKLKPGETYERALSIRVAIPAREVMSQPVTFRIGFEPRLGYNLSTQSPPYIWGDPITIRVGG